jgi:DnaJ like chaperone protein
MGKLIGGVFGLALGNPLFALIGIYIGHQFDKALSSSGNHQDHVWPWDINRIQRAFFTATFSVMGYIAKVDGRVSENEIEYARQIMFRLGLNEKMRLMAINLFTQGKQKDFDIYSAIEDFRKACGRRRSLLQMFIEIQMDAAYADGPLSKVEREALLKICSLLGFSAAEYARFEQVYQARQRFHYRAEGQYQGREKARAEAPSRTRLEDAYSILDIKSSASDAEVKKAYRKLMSKNHPDKLVSKGLPEEMIKIANQKTQEIKEAYDQIRLARGIK